MIGNFSCAMRGVVAAAVTILTLAPLSAQARENHCRPNSGPVAADTSTPVTGEFLAKMREVGVKTIIRYYDQPNETIRGKTLRRAERDFILAEGFSLAVVFQHKNKVFSSFHRQQGLADGARALVLAAENLQPKGGIIYYGIDGGWGSEAQIRKIEEYFEAINSVLRPGGYRVGVYGSGRVCKRIVDKGLADYCWLSNARGWPDYHLYHPTRAWRLLQHPTEWCGGREVDFNFTNGRHDDFGQFGPAARADAR